MTWRLAKSLITLQHEVNTAWPNRPKTADGTIGDARHQAEQSDHNPNPPHAGVVTAWDITTAPFTIDLAETFRRMGKNGDLRVKYVIYRGHITSAEHRWQWATYSGYSQHYDHIHLSVADAEAEYDRTDAWHVFDQRAQTTVNPTPLFMEDDMQIIHSPKHSYARIPGAVVIPPDLLPIYTEKWKIPVTELTDAEFMAIVNAEPHK